MRVVRRENTRTKNRKIRIAFVSALLPPSEVCTFSVYLYDDEKLHERPNVHFWLDSVFVGNFLRLLLLATALAAKFNESMKAEQRRKPKQIFRRKVARFGIITLRL